MNLKTQSNETWVESPVVGYHVSDQGRVWSYRSYKFLTPYKTSKGYLQVQLGGKTWYLSHLVWQCFHHEKPKMLVFLDGDISNCALSNLSRKDTYLGEIEIED